MKAPFLRSEHNYDTNKASDESALHCKDPSKAQQHMKDECDINVIVERFKVTGEIKQIPLPPLQGDFENIHDFKGAMNAIVAARESFQQLPANVRTKFHNNAAEFVDFCSNEQNRDEMRLMGLWSPEAVRAFELEAQSAKDLQEANKRDAEAHRATLKGKADTTKGVS